MDLFLLDPAYNKESIVDQYESLSWADSFNTLGAFELHVEPTRYNKARFKMDTVLIHSETNQPAMVDYRIVEEDDKGDTVLKVRGKSLGTILNQRSVVPNKGLEWRYKATVGNAIIRLVRDICVDGTGVSANDIIPNFMTLNASGTTEIEDISLKLGPLYDTVQALAESEKLGLRVILKKESPRLRFDVYRGVDRPKILFNSSMDYFSEENHVISHETFKNIAYVWGKDGLRNEIVTSWNTDINVSGIKRRVINVDASDIDPKDITEAEHRSQLRRRGRQVLGENRFLRVFDGSVTPLAPYKYGVDYFLGDTVYMMDDNMDRKPTTVSQYIWVSDENGIQSYPSFDAP